MCCCKGPAPLAWTVMRAVARPVSLSARNQEGVRRAACAEDGGYARVLVFGHVLRPHVVDSDGGFVEPRGPTVDVRPHHLAEGEGHKIRSRPEAGRHRTSAGGRADKYREAG